MITFDFSNNEPFSAVTIWKSNKIIMSSISLTPQQAGYIVDICQRLNIDAPMRDGELSEWLDRAITHMNDYIQRRCNRSANADAVEVILECLDAAISRMPGYDRMQELERAELFCRNKLDKS